MNVTTAVLIDPTERVEIQAPPAPSAADLFRLLDLVEADLNRDHSVVPHSPAPKEIPQPLAQP